LAAGTTPIRRTTAGRWCWSPERWKSRRREVFRDAFKGVTPSRNGPPSREEAQKNKRALMKALAPHNVTNDRLDEVSNYYRYRPQAGEMWPTSDAKAYAIVEDGKIKKIVVTEPGSGYSSPPKATIKEMKGVRLEVTLEFNKDFKKNGAIHAIEVAAPKDADEKR
jgi:hypothetical protein